MISEARGRRWRATASTAAPPPARGERRRPVSDLQIFIAALLVSVALLNSIATGSKCRSRSRSGVLATVACGHYLGYRNYDCPDASTNANFCEYLSLPSRQSDVFFDS